MAYIGELERLKIWINERILKYPEHKDRIIEFYELCLDEIDDEDASIIHEIYLCKDSIEGLIEES
jgi:hypothetical protein